jgi:hypothetical protein
MEPFDAFGAEIQTENMLMRINDYQQEQQRLRIAQENIRVNQIIAQQKAEYQANNDLLSGIWKAVTDKNTSPEIAEHLRDFADDYKRTMSRQQAQMLDITVARGLYSEGDRKRDTFKRLFKDRPTADLSNVPEAELIPKMTELKVAQAEYDVKYENFMREGSGIEKVKNPSLIPITSFIDKENNPHSIFGRRDPNTGMISSIDTGSDLEGDMFAKAMKEGWSPSLAAQHDFIPIPGSKERIVSSEGKKYSVRTGVSLTDGQTKTLKIELGEDEGSSGKNVLSFPKRVQDTVDMLNAASSGALKKEKYGKYGDIISQFRSLEDIGVGKGEKYPSANSEFGSKLLGIQMLFNKNNPGVVIAPQYENNPGGSIGTAWTGYYQEGGKYFPFPADTLTSLRVNGEEKRFWYAEKIKGQEGRHFWHDIYGRSLTQFNGIAPGSDVEDKKALEKKISAAKEYFRNIPTPKIKNNKVRLGDFLSSPITGMSEKEKSDFVQARMRGFAKQFPTRSFGELSSMLETLVKLPGKTIDALADIEISLGD